MSKILHVTDCYDGGVFDSINKFAELCTNFEHTLVYAGSSNPASDIFVDTFSLNAQSWISRWRRLKSMFNSGDYDIIHLHSSRMGFLGRLVPTSKPVVFQPHGISYEQNFPNIVRTIFLALEWLLGLRTAKFIAVSHAEKEQIKRVASSRKIAIVPNSSKMVPFYKNASRKLVVTIGQVIERKDPSLFTEIATKVSELNLGLNFVWVGSGDINLERKLHLGGVEVTGWLNKEEMAKYLSDCALYIHTASFEGFPISVIDASVFEVPIIVRDIPAFASSKLSKFKDADDAVELIRQLFSDKTRQLELEEVSRQIAIENSPEVQRSSYERVIAELVRNA